MDANKVKKERETKDLEIPSMEDEIKNWCEVPAEPDASKGANDMEIDAWCQDSSISERDSDNTKKEKK